MFRRLRRLFVALVLLIIVIVAVVVVLGNRSALDHARTRVNTRWSALRGPLQPRYVRLAVVGDALAKDLGANAGAPARLSATLRQWNTLVTPTHRDPGAEVAVADQLEGLAALVHITAQSSDRIKADQALQAAVVDFDKTAPPRGLVDLYNAAVRAYEHDRTTGVRRLPAALFGYHSRRTFEPAATS
jgi:hypothetical protein